MTQYRPKTFLACESLSDYFMAISYLRLLKAWPGRGNEAILEILDFLPPVKSNQPVFFSCRKA